MIRPDPATSQAAPTGAVRAHPVSRSELPLSCPTPTTALWSAHPRVYLPIEATGTATCPYCGAQFTLID